MGNTAAPPVFVPGDFRRALTALTTLQQAWQRVLLNRGAAGPDGVTVHEFAVSAPQRLEALRDQLHRGTYRPTPPRFFAAPKRSGGVRVIAILSVQDRIVQQALHSVLMPAVEARLPDCSYAYRPGVGAHTALRRVEMLVQQGHGWIAETDIAAFFDSISHRLLLEQLSAVVPDPFLLSLMAQCLSASAATPGTGIPQGAATSPLLSNLYLADFDRFLLTGGWNPVRYGDDLLLACDARGEAQTALSQAEGYLRSRLQLALKATKTRVVSLEQGVTFLGFHFSLAGRHPAPEAVQRLEEQLQETDPNDAPARKRRWETYYGKHTPAAAPDAEGHIPETEDHVTNEKEPGPHRARSEDETISRFLQMFAGREDCYARQGKEGGRRTFTPCAGSLSDELIGRHLAGSDSLASYLIRQDGKIRQMVLDIDAVRPPGRPRLPSAQTETAEKEADELEVQRAAQEFALDLSRVCRAFGVSGLLVDSGRKGRHLWIVFSEPVEPERARRLGRLLAKQAGFPREGARLEIFPRHSEWVGPELGDAVTLPFGVHPISGRRCSLLDETGEAVPDTAQAIASLRSLTTQNLDKIIETLTQNSVRLALRSSGAVANADALHSEAVSALMSGCQVIRSIVGKAAQTGHLRHTHQLILLYTAGHLKEEGARFIHQTISLCRNYDQAICQKYIDRLEPKHPPISCRRIREWLEEEGETGWCTCPQGRKSPMEMVTAPEAKATIARQSDKKEKREQKEKSGRGMETTLDSAEWTTIAGDLFAEP